MSAKFFPNPPVIAALGASPGVVAGLTVVAEAIAERVRAIGPVDADDDTHYIDMITVDSGVRGPIGYAQVRANKYTSWFIEFGTGIPTPAFAPMRRAAEAFGNLNPAGSGGG